MGQLPPQAGRRGVDAQPPGSDQDRGRRGILLSLHGQSVQEDSPDAARRAILTRVELLSEHERYRWLNTSFVVGEGEIDEETEEWWLQTYVCVNEVVQRPPAIGATPPPRFRQADR